MTVIVAEPLTPAEVAVTVVLPSATAVTNPDSLTVTTASSELAHVKVAPEIGLAAASKALAVNETEPPTPRTLDVGETVTEFTEKTEKEAVPVCPPALAEMCFHALRTTMARGRPRCLGRLCEAD